jgi:sorting nexin-9/18/33
MPIVNSYDSWILKVLALYDFTGEPGTAELSIAAGEILTVTRQNVGEGWWEGVNQAGQTGLFPAAYVEVRLCSCYH